MTVEKIVREIDARLVYLIQERDELETKRNCLRFLKPYREMTDKELDRIPRSSKFWVEDQKYSLRISRINHEISLLRDMKYAYEHYN